MSHLRLAWYEGSLELLAYLHEAFVRSCSRPNVTDLLNRHVMVQWILEEDHRRCGCDRYTIKAMEGLPHVYPIPSTACIANIRNPVCLHRE